MADFYDSYALVEAIIKEELAAYITWIDPGKLVNLITRLSELISDDQGAS